MESAVIHSSEVHEVDSGIPMILFKDFSTSLSLLQGDLHSPSLSSIVFTPPSVPPVLGDRNPKGREDVTALQCYICPTCPSPAGWSLILNQAFPLTIKRKGCNRPPVLGTASL